LVERNVLVQHGYSSVL